MNIGALIATSAGAVVFLVVCWRARDVLAVMKFISSLAQPEPPATYDSALALWYLRAVTFAGGLLCVAFAMTAAIALVR